MNRLEIRHDKAVSALVIRSPEHGAKVSGQALMTHGDLQRDWRLWINGGSQSIKASGGFRRAIPLTRGFNRIVYKVVDPDGLTHIYFREVRTR